MPGVSTWISVVALAVSVASFFREGLRERWRRRARLEVWQRNTFNLSTGGKRIPTEVTLLFRNRSPRPTAVLDLFVRDAKCGILGGRGYRSRIALPLQLQAWGVAEVTFQLEPADEDAAADIQIVDLDGDQVVIPQRAGRAGWHHVGSVHR